MKGEYDFTHAEQGKFYRPLESLDIPIYLDDEVKRFFLQRAQKGRFSISETVNALIKQDIEISKKLLQEDRT